MKRLFTIVTIVEMLLISGCRPDPVFDEIECCETLDASYIERYAATLNGSFNYIRHDGEEQEWKCCFIVGNDSELSDSWVVDARVPDYLRYGYDSINGYTEFYARVYELSQNSTYYYCACVMNGKSELKGEVKQFTTPKFPFDQNGASTALFSVSSSQKVYFSMGNLQYQASTGTWRFAQYQYDCIGSANSPISSSYSGWIDLFGWGTSGWNSGATCYQPWATSTSYSDYYPGGSYTNDLTGSYANADWGVYNRISNGGNQTGMWRTLTKDEWNYLISGRANASSKRGGATVNGTAGLVLLPDSWALPSGLTFNPDMNSFSGNTYTALQWSEMEYNGAIFLPAAGYRNGSSVNGVGTYGGYWSSSYSNENYACYVSFYSGSVGMFYYGRGNGFSVRLVKD